MSVDSQIKELVQETREWVEDQVEQLSEQVQQLQKQSRQLRKTLRREVRKRRKNWNRLRRFMLILSKNLQKRRENLTEGLMQRGGKITQNVLDFGGKTTQDLAERSGKFTQELSKRGERLLEPVRKRDRTFWSIVGFGIGLLTAGIITYQLVRRRVAQQETEQDEHIELPQSNSWDGSGGRPVGEISYIDQGGTSVATLEIVDVKTVEQSADAAFVGVKSTKLYYSVDTELEPEDLVYFTTEEEAKAQGFTAGE
jgi:methylphosphotriester-DNA--protein-cysteine methyltransferase